MTASLLAPYAPDLSDWDPSCRLGWWPGIDARRYRKLARVLIERNGRIRIYPELDSRAAAEEALLQAWSLAGKAAYDAHINANYPRRDDPEFDEREAEVVEDATSAEHAAQAIELNALRDVVVRVLCGKPN